MADSNVVDEILGHELGELAAEKLGKLVESAGYTTTVLFGLELWLRDNGDEAGAALMGEFCRRFAEHEASTL